MNAKRQFVQNTATSIWVFNRGALFSFIASWFRLGNASVQPDGAPQCIIRSGRKNLGEIPVQGNKYFNTRGGETEEAKRLF